MAFWKKKPSNPTDAGARVSPPDMESPRELKFDQTWWRWAWPRWVWGAVLLVWAALITWLLLAPSGWWPREWWSALRPAGHFIPLARIYAGLFSGDSWNWMVPADTWIDLGIGLAGLAVMTFVGRLLTQCWEMHLPRGVEWALAFVVGTGTCGVVFTFVALAGFLFQWVALVLVAVLIGVLWFVSDRSGWRHGEGYPDELAEALKVRRARCEVALEWERGTWFIPRGAFEQTLQFIMIAMISVLTALTFYHAVFFPETYWDSLILYLGYSRGIFLEHAFPVKVVGQVGVGLGANYPHLFELTGAVIATWANRWSPLYLQLASPVAGLLSILLVYHMALRLSRSVLTALAVTLLVRSAPYLITYHIWSANYAFAILFAAAFLYCAMRYVEDGLRSYFVFATLCAAFATHINYLMWALWICWGVLVLVTHWPRRLPLGIPAPPVLGALHPRHDHVPPDFTQTQNWPWLTEWLKTPVFLGTTVTGLAIASIWYIRNWIVTGNPVYAFFTGLFGGKNINPEVMESAAHEWQSHGDGIGIYGNELSERIAGTWPFFVNNFSTCYKWSPVFMGLIVPGIVVFLFYWVTQSVRKRDIPMMGTREVVWDDSTRFGAVAFCFVAILFGYHYLLGAFYLYHLLPAFAAFGVFGFFALRGAARPFVYAMCFWAIFSSFMPGLPWAMLGSKVTSGLTALKNPGMEPQRFYMLRYGKEPLMWERVNTVAKNTALLTHENRHLLFDPSIRLMHLDDTEIQDLWGRSDSRKLRELQELGVRYYLKIPYEADHPVNARLGHDRWIREGILQEVYRAGDSVLYRFQYPER